MVRAWSTGVNSEPKPPDVRRLLHELQHSEALQHQAVIGPELDPRLALLRAWQSRRLAQTYADLLADPQYRPACLFFLSDIYAPRDFSQRDHDAERMHAFLMRVVPAPMLQLLTEVIRLNTLTNELDRRLADILADQLGVTDTVTLDLYAEGYRRCANSAERHRQIDLLLSVVAQVGEGARLPGVGWALKLARGPARRAGWVELYSFLERGYGVFRQIRDLPAFVGTIERRERSILNKILAGDPNPLTG